MASNAALAPISASANVEEALPVAEVINPTLIFDPVTPGALAWLPDEPPWVVAVDPPEVVAGPDVVAVELLLLLEHPAVTIAARAPARTKVLYLRFKYIEPPFAQWPSSGLVIGRRRCAVRLARECC
jgi:hypothetical protein